MHESLISILMPTYNRRQWLHKAIRSVLAQTYPHWELLIIDDGGAPAEQTAAIIQQFGDSRIQFHRIKHVGNPGAVRNVGLGLAKGAFVFRLDDDDELDPTCLETLHQQFVETPFLNGVITTCLLMDASSQNTSYPPNLVRDESGKFRFEYFPSEMTWQVIYENIGRALLPCPTMLVRRSVLLDIGGYDNTLRYWEDAKLLVEILRRGLDRVRFLPLPLYFYRRHSENITLSTPATIRRWVEDKWAFFQWLYALPELPPGMESDKQQALTHIYLDHMPPLLNQGELFLARELLLEALHHPDFDDQAWQTHLSPLYLQTFPSTTSP